MSHQVADQWVNLDRASPGDPGMNHPDTRGTFAARRTGRRWCSRPCTRDRAGSESWHADGRSRRASQSTGAGPNGCSASGRDPGRPQSGRTPRRCTPLGVARGRLPWLRSAGAPAPQSRRRGATVHRPLSSRSRSQRRTMEALTPASSASRCGAQYGSDTLCHRLTLVPASLPRSTACNEAEQDRVVLVRCRGHRIERDPRSGRVRLGQQWAHQCLT